MLAIKEMVDSKD